MRNLDSVVVFRYLTPNDERFTWDGTSDDKYFDHPNLYGITMIFTLDYVRGVVNVKHSICNGDNFSKEVGLSYAHYNHTTDSFPLFLVEEHFGLVTAYIDHLSNVFEREVDQGSFEDILNLFRYAGMKQAALQY